MVLPLTFKTKMESINKYTLYTLFAMLFAISCTKEAEPGIVPEISGLENEYIATVNQTLELSPTVKNAPDALYSWLLNGVEESNTATYTFKAPSVAGTHTLIFRTTSPTGIAQKIISIEVNKFSSINISVNTLLELKRPSDFPENAKITWSVIKAPSDLFRLEYSDTGTPLFIAAKAGRYTLKATTPDGLEDGYIALVRTPEEKQSPFIARVFDYLPAPGQFVNELPKYEEGNTHADMVAKTATSLIGRDTYMITLGGWGGYVTFGFDHTIVNVKGKCDFRINGNAFGANDNHRPGAPFGGSCEPGIVMVGYDKNKNGKPDDDEWYEIKGSGNFSAEQEPWYSFAKENGNDIRTLRNYEITYHRPVSEKTDPDYDGGHNLIKKYFRWTDNQGLDTFYVKNKYHHQSYYPLWIKEDQITFKGIRLAESAVNEYKFNPGINDVGMYFVLYAFRYGYVDNYPNAHNNSGLDIDWAIDKEGNPANLPGIDFVKVYNGVNQVNGWLGEASTELDGAYDLHMSNISIKTTEN